MSIFFSSQEAEIIRNSMDDHILAGYLQAITSRVKERTFSAVYGDRETTTSFWHNAAEYIGDAAFAGALLEDEKIKNYVRQSALAIAQMPQENWQGPAFRQRTNPPKGFLETAHLSIALSLALDLCKDAFTAAEYDLCADALKNHAVPLCRAWLNNKPHFLNNWNAVLTCGVAMPAAVLDLEEELEFCSGYLPRLAGLLQSDGSYGEGLQYGNYFLWAFLLANEALIRSGHASVPLERAGKYLEYCHFNLLTDKPLSNWGAYNRPRCFNFDDCTAIFAPNPDILTLLGTRLKDSMPEHASLARLLLEKFYSSNFAQGPFDRTSFGFVPRAGWMTLLFCGQMKKEYTTAEFGNTKACKNGVAVIRTGTWSGNDLAVAVKAPAPEGLGSAGHRHLDINSIQLFFGNERLLADPGHTCYRSLTRSADVATENHSTCTFETKDRKISQKRFPVRLTLADGSFGEPPVIPGKLEFCGGSGEVSAIVSEAAECYESSIKLFRRFVFVCGKNCVFIIDDIDTDEAVKTSWTWCFNNRDGILKLDKSANGDFTKITARRGNAGLNIFNTCVQGIKTSAERYGFLHDAYHPDADGPGRGNAGTALLSGHQEKDFSTGFRRNIFALTADFYGRDNLWNCQALSERSAALINQVDGQNWVIDAEESGSIVITDRSSGKCYTLQGGSGTWELLA